MPTEQTYLVKRLLADPALSDCSVTVLSSLADDPELLADFAALPGQEPRLMYRGRMVLAEQDVLTWRILEKNPDACVSCPELDAERDRLIRREWRRIWGSLHFDVCLVLGGLGWQQYHMAMAGNFEKRILIDLDFLDNFREKAPARWNRALTGFDEIFCLPAGKGLGAYGAENKDRVRRLPVFSPQKNSVGDGIFAGGASETKISGDENGKSVSPALSGEPLEYCGSEYIVLGCRRDGARKRLILLKLPASGAVLGRDGFRVDDRFWKYLYFLPAADCFFDRLSGCVRNAALEYDAVSEICRTRGVPILTEGNFPCGAK